MPFRNKSAMLLVAASFAVASNLEAKTSFVVEGDSVTIDNCKGVFDKGNFVVRGNPYSLVVPEYKQFGLEYGMKLKVVALELGYTPEMWGNGPASKIVLERDGYDAKKFTSRSYIRDDTNTMMSSEGAAIPRIIYSFEGATIKVGEPYKITFLDVEGKPLETVRYAVCAMDDALCIFSDLRFTVNGTRYVPVYALKLQKPSANTPPPAPPPPPPPPPKPAMPEPKPEPKFERHASKPEPKSHVVHISLNQPTKVSHVTQDDENSYHGFYYDRSVEVKSTTYQYSGKISCSATPREETTVDIEVYYVVRDIAKSAKDKIGGSKVLGSFKFGGKNAKTQPLQFRTPTYEETKTRKSHSGYYAGRSESERSGTRFMGVIVRALENGEVRKVVSMPSSQDWDKIGKKPTVTFDAF